MKKSFLVAAVAGSALSLAPLMAAANSDVAVEKVDAPFPANVSGQSAPLIEEVPSFTDSQVADFEIRKGERIKKAMERWTQMVGYTLVWMPKPEDGDITFATTMVYRDAFKDAAEDFFDLVRTQTKFDGQVHDNGVLRVFVASDNQ
jgi:hypothetical protein